jgi:hypothetical protein
MQRRDFIRKFAIAAVALSAGGTARLLADEPFPMVGKEGWSAAAFERLDGDYFDVRAPGGTHRLRLSQVRHRRRRNVESASLRFCGDGRLRLAEGSHRFAHPMLGEIDIFVVPGTSTGGVRSYRATFARFV